MHIYTGTIITGCVVGIVLVIAGLLVSIVLILKMGFTYTVALFGLKRTLCKSSHFHHEMFDALQPGVSVRLLCGELLLEHMPPTYMDMQGMYEIEKRGIPYSKPERCGLFKMTTSTRSGATRLFWDFLYGQTNLVVVLSSFKFFGLTDDQVASMREEHFDYLHQKTAELKFSLCFWCNADRYNGYPIQHTRYDCRPEAVECFITLRYKLTLVKYYCKS